MSYTWVLSTLCCALALDAAACAIPRAKPQSDLIFLGPEPMASRCGIHFPLYCVSSNGFRRVAQSK